MLGAENQVHHKPMNQVPTSISVDHERGVVHFVWEDTDGLVSITNLRRYCPCAECQGHVGEIRAVASQCDGVEAIEMVGTYAVQIFFNDHHNTGIYRWSYLRSLVRAHRELDAGDVTFSREGELSA